MRCKINRQTFRGIPGFHSTSGYTAVVFSTHLVAVKCEGFTATSTREYSYAFGQQPSWHVTPTAGNPADTSPLLPANRFRESIAHAGRF